ncbi:MAG: hypothetical protein IKA56_00510 [Clostridia bacterium]|nr:hypothetical protein [Clostridia bacterium]
MLEWLSQNWYITAALFALLLIAFFALIKVASGHNKLVESRQAKLKKLHELRSDFENMTGEAFDNAEDGYLLDGVALYYQLKLQKCDDMNEAFTYLPEPARYVYALNIFYFEGGVLSGFYRANGEPLSPVLADALRAIGEGELAEIAEKLQPMFDEENENASIDYKFIKTLDENASEVYNEKEFKLKAAAYIRKNKEVFFSANN